MRTKENNRDRWWTIKQQTLKERQKKKKVTGSGTVEL
jgi:hypothetical protein